MKKLSPQILLIRLIINKITKMARFFAVWFSKNSLIMSVKKLFVFVYLFAVCVNKVQETGRNIIE